MNIPVLLVHGIYDTDSIFKKMKRELSKNGKQQVHSVNIIPPNASIDFETMGEQISCAAKEILKTTKENKIDIIGYSMGALASRYYIQKMGGKSNVRRYISISGPHHGTVSAFLSSTIGSKQMRPGSQFLKELNKVEGMWDEVEVYSIRSRFDLMVFPSKTSVLVNAKNIICNVLFHNCMVSDRRVINKVVKILH